MLEHQDERAWIPIRQRLQQNAIDDREDRRIRSDSDRESQYSDAGKPGIPSQLPKTISDVLTQLVEPRRDPRASGIFARQKRIAHHAPAARHSFVRRKTGSSKVLLFH